MHGSNTPGCVDGDKQEMNTMSECQVKGPEKSMMESLESMKEGGTGGKVEQDTVATVRQKEVVRSQWIRDSKSERVHKGINLQHARMAMQDWELESEMKWSAGGGRWSWLNSCPEYCTNCGREADTIAERSHVASINKIN